jgi:hypothetical protein
VDIALDDRLGIFFSILREKEQTETLWLTHA